MNETQKPVISVVVPVYNRENLVARTLTSVLDQTFGRFEIIVVDDGSTDATLAVVQQFDDSRILAVQQQNLGVSAARNAGASIASGEFLVFLDSDDLAEPDWLQTHVKLARQESAAIVFSSHRRVGSDSYSEHVLRPFSSSGVPRPIYLPGSYFVRREIFIEAGGFDEQLRFSENHELGIRLNELCRSKGLHQAFTAEVLISMDRSESGDSHPWKLHAVERILEKHAAEIKSERVRHGRWLGMAAVECARHGKSRAAIRYATHAAMKVPFNHRSWLRLGATLVPPIGRRRWGSYSNSPLAS